MVGKVKAPAKVEAMVSYFTEDDESNTDEEVLGNEDGNQD